MGNNPLDDEPCRPIFWQDEIDALLLRKVCRSANQSAVWSLEPGFQQPACLAQGRGAADEGDQLDTLKEMQGAVATEGEYDSASRNISGTNLAQTPVLDDGNALTPPAIESLNGVLSPAQLCRDEEMNVEMDMAPAENTFPFKDSKKIKEGPEATSISGWSLSLDSSESADECSEDESALRKAAFGGSPAAGGTAYTRGTRSAIIGFQSLQSVAQKALASAGAQAGAVASNFEAQAVDAGIMLQLRAAAALEGIAERARKARLRAEAAWLESRNRGHESAWLLFSPCVPESIRSLPCSKALLSGPGGETGITEEVTSAEASRDSADTEASGEEGHAMLQGTRESTASGCLVLEPFCLSLGNPLTIMLGTFAAGASHAESGLLIATEQVKPAASAALDAAWAVDEAFMSAVRALDDALASGWAMIEAFGHKSVATLGVVVGDMIPGEKRNLTRVGTQSSGERDGDRGVVVRSKHRGRSNYNSAPSGTEAHVPESVCGEDNIDTLQKMRITPSMVSWMPVAERPASAAVGYTENDAAGLFSDTESWTGAMARAAAALECLAGHSTKVTRHSEGSATPGVIAQCVEAEAWSELAKGGAHGTCLPWGHRKKHRAAGQHSSASPVMADSASAGGARDQCGSQNWFRWQKSRVTNRLFVVAWNVVKWTRSGLRRPLRQESQLPPSMVVCAPACLMKVCSQPEPNQAAAGTVSLDVQVGATEPALSLATVARIPLPGSTLQARQTLQLKKSPRGYVLVFKKAEKRCNFKNSTVEPTASRESPLQVFNPD